MKSISVSSVVQTPRFWRSQSGRSIVGLALATATFALCPLSVLADDPPPYKSIKVVTIKLKEDGQIFTSITGEATALAESCKKRDAPAPVPLVANDYDARNSATVEGNTAMSHARVIIPLTQDNTKIVRFIVDGEAHSHNGVKATATSSISAVVNGDVINVSSG